MGIQEIFNIVLLIAGFFGGIWVKSIHQSVRDLQASDKELVQEVQKIQVLVAGEYVRREDFDKKVDALFAKLDRIEQKIDNKVDKSECDRVHT